MLFYLGLGLFAFGLWEFFGFVSMMFPAVALVVYLVYDALWRAIIWSAKHLWATRKQDLFARRGALEKQYGEAIGKVTPIRRK